MKLIEEKTIKVIEFTQEEFNDLLIILDRAIFDDEEEDKATLSQNADRLYSDLYKIEMAQSKQM